MVVNHLKKNKIEDLDEFDNHRFIILIDDPKTGLRGFIGVHRGGLEYPSFGATRFWTYGSELEALKDALRLSRMMSYKSALAGLPYGGAKAALIASPQALKNRSRVLRSYAQRLNYLNGRFITGTDVGMSQKDLIGMGKTTEFLVGYKANPEYFTGMGIFYSIQAALKEVFGTDEISGRNFAIQGVGKTGSQIISLLYERGAKIIVADIDKKKIQSIKKKFPKIKVVKSEEIYAQEVDVYSPCALSHSLTALTIPRLRSKIIVGSANNQLENPRIGEALHKSGILYAPDYVVNAGGLISVVHEYETKDYNPQQTLTRVKKIGDTVSQIFKESHRRKLATNIIADRMAERIFNRTSQ